MTANAINTVLGIVLVYFAVLEPGAAAGNPVVLAAVGVVACALAFWALRSDLIRAFNATNLALGIALVVVGLWHATNPLNQLVLFWVLFWIGTIIAVFACWALLYNRAPS